MSVRPGIDVIVGGDAPPPQGRSAWFIVATSSAACIGIALASGTHLGLVFILLPAFVAIVWQSPKTMIAILPVWMVLLGLIRRLTPGGGNITFSGDPVLIIGPIVILLLFFVAEARSSTAPGSPPRSARSARSRFSRPSTPSRATCSPVSAGSSSSWCRCSRFGLVARSSTRRSRSRSSARLPCSDCARPSTG
jgi:hypothetical protein